MVKRMDRTHVDAVAAVHLASFPDFFLSFLGVRFLRLYYSGICNAPEGIGLVYVNHDSLPVGFVAGTANPRKFYSKLLKRDWLRFALASAGAMCRKPAIIPRLARAISHPSENPAGDQIAGLFSLGVLPAYQGKNVGRKLVQTFLEEAGRQGCREVFLTTDSDDNDGVNSFYQKNGFHVARQYVTREGRRMNEYRIVISENRKKGDTDA